ncbi:MAG: DUF4275 family protein [Bacillota bacterium]
MEIIDMLKSKGVKVTEIPKWGTFLRKQWEDNFANHLSHREKEAIYLYDVDGVCGYLWHLFSYEKRDCLKGEEAEQAFNDEQKNACYIFYQDTDDALILEEAAAFNTNDLLNESDVYVVDKEFSWTYVKTHEVGWCGPYFSRSDVKF